MPLNCKSCKYGNGERRFCGKGLKLIHGGCSGYVPGRVATLSHPPLYKAMGSFLPVHVVNGYSYNLFVSPNEDNPCSRALYKIARYLSRHYPALTALRYQCHFNKDYYGNLYPYTHCPWGPTSTDNRKDKRAALCGILLHCTQSNTYEICIKWALTRCRGEFTYLPTERIWSGPYDPDLPPHYWWLDITAPVEELIPMHSLIRAVCTVSTKELNGYLTLGSVLRRALVLGLEYKARPLDQWADAIMELAVRVYQKGVVPIAHKRQYHSKGYPDRLLREWSILNALEGY